MDRFQILKNPDLQPCHAYALTPEEQRRQEEEKRFKEEQARRTPQDIERESIISQYFRTAQGRQQLAASMTNPFRQRMDMGSLARRLFLVDPLQDEHLPLYSRTGDNPAYMISDTGGNVLSITAANIRNIIAPLFEIATNPQIPLRDLQRENRFQLIERAQDIAYHEIISREETLALQLLTIAGNNRDIVVPEFNSESTIGRVLANAFASIETYDFRVANIFLNATDFSTIHQHLGNVLDPSTPDLLTRSGIIGSLWGSQIQVTRSIPAGEIYISAEPQHVGRMPIRTDLTIFPADDPVTQAVGWLISEQIGMVCLNPTAIARIRVPQITETIRSNGFGDHIDSIQNIIETM